MAESKIAAIMSAVDAAAAEEEPEKLDASAKKSGSLASQAAEGFKAIGSFFAQAAMGGAEVRNAALFSSCHCTALKTPDRPLMCCLRSLRNVTFTPLLWCSCQH